MRENRAKIDGRPEHRLHEWRVCRTALRIKEGGRSWRPYYEMRSVARAGSGITSPRRRASCRRRRIMVTSARRRAVRPGCGQAATARTCITRLMGQWCWRRVETDRTFHAAALSTQCRRIGRPSAADSRAFDCSCVGQRALQQVQAYGGISRTDGKSCNTSGPLDAAAGMPFLASIMARKRLWLTAWIARAFGTPNASVPGDEQQVGPVPAAR